jgi:hypothetical protein
MSFFDASKSLIENIYFLCAPILVIVSIFGLAQLWIAKYTLRINSKREAALLTMQLIEKHIPNIEKQYDEITDKLVDLDIDYQKLEEARIRKFTIQEVRELLPEQYDLLEKIFENMRYDFLRFLNALETYSVPIMNRIADEDLAFNNDCLIFIQSVRLSAYFIAKEKEDDKIKILFENVIKLYRIWDDRVIAMRMDDEITELIGNRVKIKPTKIKPLGAD